MQEKIQHKVIRGHKNGYLSRRTAILLINWLFIFYCVFQLDDNEFGLDEGVEEGSSSLEPLSQDDCSSEGSGPRPRHARVRKEPMSLTVKHELLFFFLNSHKKSKNLNDVENTRRHKVECA